MLAYLANVAAILAAIKVLTDCVGAWVEQDQHERLRSTVDDLHKSLALETAEGVRKRLLLWVASIHEKLFGANPFSAKAFKRSCCFGALFLGASLGLVGLFTGKPFGMNLLPWRSFFASLDYLKILANEPAIKQQVDGFYIAQNAADLARFNNWPAAICFTIYFALLVTTVAAVLFSANVGLSRLFLREMISVRTGFQVVVLFLSSSVLVVLTGASATLLLFGLVNIWTWPFVPLLFSLPKISVLVGAGIISAASLFAWFFSAPWLRVVICLSLLPSLSIAVVLCLAILGNPVLSQLHRLAAKLLGSALRSPKGIFSFVSATSAGLAFVLLTVAALLASVAQFSLRLGAPRFLGMDAVILSALVLLVALFVSIANGTRGSARSDLRAHTEPLFVFLLTIAVITLGFYFQAILECLITPDEAGAREGPFALSLPAIGAIIPASVAGCLVVMSGRGGWVRTGIRVFLILAAIDLLHGLRGLSPYRGVLLSICCDLIGAPAAAIVIVTARDRLFPMKDGTADLTACAGSD